MSLLIDGYNLLHVTGIVGSKIGPATFQRARNALLNFLAAALDETERTSTTIVFDGRDAPPGLPKHLSHAGMTVRYAPRHLEADDVIEELIAADHSPRRLVVVSSDHRLQRAAQRRKAQAVDSHIWYGELVRRRATGGGEPQAPARPAGPLTEGEVARWLAEFGDISVDAVRQELREAEAAAAKTPSEAKGESGKEKDAGDAKDQAKPAGTGDPGAKKRAKRRRRGKPGSGKDRVENPFPPGYAEDIMRELRESEGSLNPFPPGYGEEELDEED